MLAPFHAATVELSEERRLSVSKVIPLLSMLHHSLEKEEMGIVQTPESTEMAESLRKQLKEKLYTLQSMSIMSLATLLEPRLKKIGFFSSNKAAEYRGPSGLRTQPPPVLPVHAGLCGNTQF